LTHECGQLALVWQTNLPAQANCSIPTMQTSEVLLKYRLNHDSLLPNIFKKTSASYDLLYSLGL